MGGLSTDTLAIFLDPAKLREIYRRWDGQNKANLRKHGRSVRRRALTTRLDGYWVAPDADPWRGTAVGVLHGG